MAESFIGLPMLVTLRNPPTRLRGTVSEVQAGHGLTLTNVWNIDINRWEPRVSILSSNIVDILYLRDEPSPQTAVPAPAPPPHVVPVAPQAVPQVAPPVVQPPSPTKPAAAAFVDPAILSVGKRPGSLSGHTSDASRHQPNTSEKRDPTPAVIPSNNVVPIPSGISTPTIPVVERLKRLELDAQTSTQDSADEDIAPEASSQQGTATVQKKKNNRRTRRAGNSSRNGLQEDSEASPQVPRATAKGKGWRQTPILQSTASFQPFNSLKKMRGANDNGWASEDVTDVQEAGDFDFESGLAKFNKQDLFEQMRKDDLIDEADRLVSHNRVPRHKPGTAGGKNLHHSENVLDMPSTIPKPKPTTSNDFWNSEADDGVINGADRLSGRDQASRQGSRRGESKAASSRRSNSRKASGVPAAHPLSRVNSSGVSHYRTLSAKGSRPSSRLSARTTGVDKKKQPASTVAASPQGLYVLPSDRKIEPVSALQMLNLENIAHNEIGLTEEMMTENAGRGIAEVTLTALSDPAIKVRHSSIVDPTSGNPPPPTVVVLAGNNKSGIRAVAAARHLRNKNISVIVCVVGLERGERDLLEDMRQQVRLYKNMGGRIFSKSDFFEHLRKISIPMLTIDTPRSSLSSLANPAPIMLIIDALLGLAISFEELRNGDQATVYELIEWANRNEAFALAVDIPTGIDPSTGKVSVIDGNKLYVKPRYVVAVGAPKRGLLEALMAAENDDGDTVLAGGDTSLPDDAVLEWKLYLVDLGLGPAMWKKAGTKMRRGMNFEDRWVVEMTYRGLVEEEDEELV
ncbi:YjeF-related protein N-terminus-domain-containing protein [Sordaria brevicollis]|uniref:Enhancer of mRNA-decapping protein 3 n=1 Tax=Sordaria brevicollis TaxID=83679 RepID=A0AAE0PFY2_SORBR|nr:YjeF-related protein N-terminus-domain-containing protein [Sordaria brevicollis]